MKNKPAKPPKMQPRLELRGKVSITAGAAPGEPVKQRRFKMLANTGEPMNIWGFESPVVVDLASIDTTGLPVPALYDHCAYGTDYIVGLVESAGMEGAGFYAEGPFAPTDDPYDHANKVLAKADAGYQWQVSIGGDPKSVEKVQAGQSVQVNGRTYPGPVSVARGLTLREISFVVLGADRRTSAVISRVKGSRMSFEDFVQSMGFSPDKLDETQAANLKRIHSEQYPEDEPDEEPDADASTDAPAAQAADDDEPDEEPTNAAAAPVKVKAKTKPVLSAAEKKALRDTETKRVKGIASICATYEHPDYAHTSEEGEPVKVKLADYAIEHEWSVEKVKAKILDDIRKERVAPAVLVKKDDREGRLAVLQGALLLRSRGKKGVGVDYVFKNREAVRALSLPDWLRLDVNAPARDRIMNAACDHTHLSMVDLCREALRLDGLPGAEIPLRSDEIVAAAIVGAGPRPRVRAASSGSNLANIFTTSVNAQLLASYEQSPDTTAGWTSEAEVNNFQTQERTRIDIGGGLKKRPKGKSAEHANYSDSRETYKVWNYAKQFVVDEQDLMDDNLNGLSTVPGDFGRAAARLRPDLVYYLMLSNDGDGPTLSATSRALFNTTDGSLASSAGDLNADRLTTGIAAMANFRENSVNLNLEATHLLVAPEFKMLAVELTQSPQILYGGDDEAVRGVMNALREQNLQVVSESRLSTGVTDPDTGTAGTGDADAWYLICANARTIEVGYLKGTGRAPRVRSKVLDAGYYGMQWDVDMTIGVVALDWKGFFKNDGA